METFTAGCAPKVPPDAAVHRAGRARRARTVRWNRLLDASICYGQINSIAAPNPILIKPSAAHKRSREMSGRSQRPRPATEQSARPSAAHSGPNATAMGRKWRPTANRIAKSSARAHSRLTLCFVRGVFDGRCEGAVDPTKKAGESRRSEAKRLETLQRRGNKAIAPRHPNKSERPRAQDLRQEKEVSDGCPRVGFHGRYLTFEFTRARKPPKAAAARRRATKG